MDVLHETTVTALRRDGQGRVLGVRAASRGGRTIELAASMTVGADGIRSTVAELAGRTGHPAGPVVLGRALPIPQWPVGRRIRVGVRRRCRRRPDTHQ